MDDAVGCIALPRYYNILYYIEVPIYNNKKIKIYKQELD